MAGDQELNFSSKLFNPDKTLESEDPPGGFSDEGKEFENLDTFRDSAHSEELKTSKHYRDISGVTGPMGVPIQRVKKEPIVRNFTMEQAPVQKVQKKQNNIFTRMESMQGPLAVLNLCKERNLKVKVYTRTNKGIRSILVANVVAFDKHWNMALTNVEETFIKPIKCRKAALDDVSNYVRVADLSIQEKDDVYVEPSPLMSARKSFTPIEEKDEDAFQGEGTIYFQRMKKRYDDTVNKVKMLKQKKKEEEEKRLKDLECKAKDYAESKVPELSELDQESAKKEVETPVHKHDTVKQAINKENPDPPSSYELGPSDEAPTASNPGNQKSQTPTTPYGAYALSNFKIPKKKSTPRERFYAREDKRSQGIRLDEGKTSHKVYNDSHRLTLSYAASENISESVDENKNLSKNESMKEPGAKRNRTRKRKKFEMRHRKAKQLLLRGQQVVLVAVADSDQLAAQSSQS